MFVAILFLCDVVLTQEWEYESQNVYRSERARQEQTLNETREALKEALEKGPPIPPEEYLLQLQKWLDDARRGRFPSVSDRDIQQRQEWLDNARQGQYPLSYSDEELHQIKQNLEKVEQQLRELSEEQQRLDDAMGHKEYIGDMLRKGFVHREQIKSGQMEITCRTTMMNRNGGLDNERDRNITLAFDEGRQRVDKRDVFRNNPHAGDNTPHVSVGCVGCYNGDNRLLVEYSQHVKADDPSSHSVLSIYDTGLRFKGQEATNLWTNELSFIPQYIVYFHTNRFPTKKTIGDAKSLLFATTVGTLESGITGVSIIEEEYKGTPCKKITFDTQSSDGAVMLTTLWIAVEQGYSLRKHHTQISGSKMANYDELLEVDVALDKGSGVWFPSAWHYKRNNDGIPFISQTGTIKNVVLNKPIPEKVFTMQDIKIIPEGIRAYWNTELVPPPHEAQRGALIWDGTNIVTQGMFNEGLVENLVAQSRVERFKMVTLVNVAVIGLILTVFFWRMYQRMKQQG